MFWPDKLLLLWSDEKISVLPCVTLTLCHSVCPSDLWSGCVPSGLLRTAGQIWMSVRPRVLLSQPSNPPSADRQGQGLIPPVSSYSWQTFLRETTSGQLYAHWHVPSPINITSVFSNVLPQRLVLRVGSDHLVPLLLAESQFHNLHNLYFSVLNF